MELTDNSQTGSSGYEENKTLDHAPKGCRVNKKEQAILALLQHGSVEKAAQGVGIHPSTLWRWLKQPAFQQKLREARREAFSQSIGRLQQASPAAVGTLLRIMTDGHAPAGSRVRAAESVLAQSQKSFELEDLEVRIAQLEKSARDNRGQQP
jgi:transposase-like protein